MPKATPPSTPLPSPQLNAHPFTTCPENSQKNKKCHVILIKLYVIINSELQVLIWLVHYQDTDYTDRRTLNWYILQWYQRTFSVWMSLMSILYFGSPQTCPLSCLSYTTWWPRHCRGYKEASCWTLVHWLETDKKWNKKLLKNKNKNKKQIFKYLNDTCTSVIRLSKLRISIKRSRKTK